ncbi:MAG: insulinase family protein [Magnetococcales bacterium]|nr:insulinase family protein [Magnetococcales bacterium]
MSSGHWLGLLALIILLPLGSVQSAPLPSRDLTLENGLRMVLVRAPRAPLVVVQVWYRVGAMDEQNGKTGLAHMLEHMMFQGTESTPPAEYSKIISRHGGENNASTSHDYTNYYAKISSEHLELVLRLEADRMRNLVLKEKEFLSENKVVQEERRVRTDADPNARMMEKYRALSYGEHPYGRPVIGPMKDIQGLNLADLKGWYKRYYAPNNAILVVAGDLELDGAEALVRKHFGPLKADPDLQPVHSPPLSIPKAPKRLEVRDAEARLPIWVAGFPFPSGMDSKSQDDAFALDLLMTAMGGGSSSRLNQSLVRHKKLAVSARAGGGGFYGRSGGMGSIHVTPRPGVSLEKIEQAVFEEVDRLRWDPISDRELERIKNSMLAADVYEKDSINSMATTIGRVLVSGGDWKLHTEKFTQLVRAVTADAVRDAAQHYLDPQRVTVGILLPEKRTPTQKRPLVESSSKAGTPSPAEPSPSADKADTSSLVLKGVTP